MSGDIVTSEASFSVTTPTLEQAWCYTQRQVIDLNYDWIIEHFTLHGKETNEYLLSPTFYSKTHPKVQWRLQLFPRGRSEETKDFLAVFLHNFSAASGAQVPAKYKLSLFNPTRLLAKSTLRLQTFHNARGWGSPKLFRHDALVEQLIDDRLKIHCQIIFEVGQTNLTSFENKSSTTTAAPQAATLSSHFGRLFDDMQFSDVTLSVGGERFVAHKVVLMARSPVLAAMFQHDTRESQTSRLDVEDIEPDVFRACLRFMYTDGVEELDKMARELLKAADKYMLDLLKRQCEDQLAKELTVDNAPQLLMLADLHSADRLKREAMEFIRARIHAVLDTSGWSDMARSRPSLIVEAFRQSKQCDSVSLVL